MRLISIIFLFFLSFSSCQESFHVRYDTDIIDTLIGVKENYSQYSLSNFKFEEDAVFTNENDSIISRLEFFENVYKNSFFPLKATNGNYYKLVKIKYWPNKNIYAWVSGVGFRHFKEESLIGKILLKKALVDMQGNTIDSNFIKGKHVFVKCWFIKCIPCVAEMPELNKIVNKMKDRKDIVFLSFAFDKRDSLKVFLEKTDFKYKVLPTYKIPEIDSFGFVSFPTHLYVENNKIIKVINKDQILDIIKQIDKGDNK